MVTMQNVTPATGVCGDSALGSTDGGRDERFYAGFGPEWGALIHNDALIAIRVMPTRTSRASIGAALCVGRDESGAALWELTVHGAEFPGRWVVIDGKFRPAQ